MIIKGHLAALAQETRLAVYRLLVENAPEGLTAGQVAEWLGIPPPSLSVPSRQPMTAHWGIPDPAAVEGTEEHKREAFAEAVRSLLDRIQAFVTLPLDKLDRLSLQHRVSQLGKSSAQAHAGGA